MAMVCSHPLGADSGRLCSHLLTDYDCGYILRFTGRGIERELVCPNCREAPSDTLVRVCAVCLDQRGLPVFEAVEIVGAPQILTRESSLRFEHRELIVPELAPLQAVAPLLASRSPWLGVTQASALVCIDVAAATVEPIAEIPGELLAEPIELLTSGCGRFAAIVSRRGRHGVVVDLATRRITLALDRGNYHNRVTDFSIAFARDGERTLVIHATDWNRLDISDPDTGELLTPRVTGYGEPHDLDYFHAGLTVSPDGRWLIDDGWVWAPVGVLQAFDLHRWIHENVWESEDGPNVVTLREVGYFWDGPRCFSADGQLIVGGYGPDDEIMVDGALIFEPASGKLERWFAGPPRTGAFVFDHYLFASEPLHGTSVWDAATGERVCHDPSLVPDAYHPGSRSFLSLGDPGRVRVSKLVDDPPT